MLGRTGLDLLPPREDWLASSLVVLMANSSNFGSSRDDVLERLDRTASSEVYTIGTNDQICCHDYAIVKGDLAHFDVDIHDFVPKLNHSFDAMS